MALIELARQVLGFVGMFSFLAGLTAPEPAAPNFAGKVVVVILKDATGACLEGASVRRVGGRMFVTGRSVTLGHRSDLVEGSTIWLAVDDITRMVEFPSVEEARNRYAATSLSAKAVEIDADVTEMFTRSFSIAVRTDPDRRAGIAKLRLHVSRDAGKTWAVHAEYEPNVTQAAYTAPADGVYWFALQVVEKGGRLDPPDAAGFVPGAKIFANAEWKQVVRRPVGP